MKKFFKTKKIRALLAAAVLLVVILAALELWVYAQSVSDTFTDDTLIASVWNTEVATSSGVVRLAQKSCDTYDWLCSASTTCANTLGDGDYIIVAQENVSTTKAWKSAQTWCDKPQCSYNGSTGGDNLKADNTLDFSDYPAREYCQSIGGRLPTVSELTCIYNNRADLGNNYGTGSFWSSGEDSETNANYVYFSTGGSYTNYKTKTSYVRCVQGW